MSKKAFSLMELMIVVIVVGVVSAVALPNYEHMRSRQRERVAAGNMEMLIEAVKIYKSKHNGTISGFTDVNQINEQLNVELVNSDNISYECQIGTSDSISPSGAFFCAALYNDGPSKWAITFNFDVKDAPAVVHCYSDLYNGVDYGHCPSCRTTGCPWNQ